MTKESAYKMQMIWDIFSGRELTLYKDTSVLSKYHRTKKSYEVPYYISRIFISHGILIEDSGNFETGEIHYVLNEKELFIKNWLSLMKVIESDHSEKDKYFLLNDLVGIHRDIKLSKILQ